MHSVPFAVKLPITPSGSVLSSIWSNLNVTPVRGSFVSLSTLFIVIVLSILEYVTTTCLSSVIFVNCGIV